MGCFVVSTEAADIVRSVQDCLFYLRKKMRGRLTADVCGSGDDRMSELCAEGLAEGLVGDPYSDRSVFGNQVRREITGIRVDDGEGLGDLVISRSRDRDITRSFKQSPRGIGDVGNVVVQFGRGIEQHEHGFGVFALLEGIDAFDCFGIGSIATDTPNGIRRINNDSARTQHAQSFLQIFLIIAVGIHFLLFVSGDSPAFSMQRYCFFLILANKTYNFKKNS